MSIKMRIGPRSYRIEIGVLIRKESEDVEDFSSHAAVLEIAQGVEIRSRLRVHRHLKRGIPILSATYKLSPSKMSSRELVSSLHDVCPQPAPDLKV